MRTFSHGNGLFRGRLTQWDIPDLPKSIEEMQSFNTKPLYSVFFIIFNQQVFCFG